MDIVDSTNDYLIRDLENNRITKDKIVVARMQTNGHGTNGRTFMSAKDFGIYFTLLHIYSNETELKFLTQKVAVAVYLTFKKIFNVEFSIKWVNDLYFNNKKICGILCKNLIKYKAVLIGIGIDLFKNDNVEKDLKNVVGYIFENKQDLLRNLDNKSKLLNESELKRNIYSDFASINNKIVLDESNIWEPDHLVYEIVFNIYDLIKVEGLPSLYIEKNIVKDSKVYEDCYLEC